MSTIDLRTPRRRVPRTGANDSGNDVIQLPAPQQTTTQLPTRNETPTTPRHVGMQRFSLRSRFQQRSASVQARNALASIAGQPNTETPLVTVERPQRSLKHLAPVLKAKMKTRRRLLAHAMILLVACFIAAGRGFPVYEDYDHVHEGEGDAVALHVEGEADADFAKVVIPMSATQPNAIGGIKHDEPLVDVGPALIKPAPQRGPAYVATHTVDAGETIATIAEAYGISPESLIAANDFTGLLAIGEKLRIPRISGVPHVVDDGETLQDIASRYGVKPEEIMTYPPNGLDQGQALVAGREIFVPNASLAGVSNTSVRGAIESINNKAQAAATVLEDRSNLRKGPSTKHEKIGKVDAGVRLIVLAKHEDWIKVRQPSGDVAWVSSEVVSMPETVWANLAETNDFPPPPPPPPVWVWPSYGDFTSGFGYRWGTLHNGIDIANARGTPIVAARSGTVIEAGWCSGYGYCVKISHGGGMITEYGHMMSRPVVYSGQAVEAGQLIGYMGSTYDRAGGGYSTGVHLHFTIKINGGAVNPLRYLP